MRNGYDYPGGVGHGYPGEGSPDEGLRGEGSRDQGLRRLRTLTWRPARLSRSSPPPLARPGLAAFALSPPMAAGPGPA
ncbi:MAG TPA: hypothetical protein VMI73_04410 [Trebonia sp.]|nr:hypothetical protein [Trebonia sp.]